jgi:hypothetical protein
MSYEHPTHCGPSDDAIAAGRCDALVQRFVLTQVLTLHPDRLAILELAITFERVAPRVGRGDAIERAVRELTRNGLLLCDCRYIWPTTRALRRRDDLPEL